MKESIFSPSRERLLENVRRYEWARRRQEEIVAAAEPWRKMSDDQLWDLMFGNTIRRSWMIWSNGFCPSCRRDVPMYTWRIDALRFPWKVTCPHCHEQFPKNDFAAFYASGRDERGIFDPARADRSLLFNVEHPNPSDPLYRFGVDDGEGYVEGEYRWRFIGAYLIYGQWKQLILEGIERLSEAYEVTGDLVFAHKAGILLDRVADLYPTHDFGKEGVMYEGPARSGYVSTWHDACEETYHLALAYDRVRPALVQDAELVAFLAEKAERYHVPRPKTTPQAILANIEAGILRDPLANREKVYSNYPRTESLYATLLALLDKEGNRPQIEALLDEVLTKATAVDGVTGEKGLAGYTAYAVRDVARLLAQFSRVWKDFLREMTRRHPRLFDMFRFHIETWINGEYYPQIGDTGAFGVKVPQYVGVSFPIKAGIERSSFSFLWELYELSGDPAFVQVIYRANGDSIEGLPYELDAEDPEAFRSAVAEVIRQYGKVPVVGSVNKQEWCLAILRKRDRALWLDYDSGGAHGHADGMNIGLFAFGLDLMPDFGYPPVQFGGWGSPRAVWYTLTAAHNTVVVDGKNQRSAKGKTTLWADGDVFQAVGASGPELMGGSEYARTVAMVEIDSEAFYLVDVFRVVGGRDHTKFQHATFGTVSTGGLSLKETEDYGFGTQMRHFRVDSSPAPTWYVDWTLEDRYDYLRPRRDLHLRYTDLTADAEAYLAEAWIALGISSTEEVWIPCVGTRRRGRTEPLESTFVAVMEPYIGTPRLAAIRRFLPGDVPESHVALEISLRDGRKDLFLLRDEKAPFSTVADVEFEGQLLWIRRLPSGQVERLAIVGGKRAQGEGFFIDLGEPTSFAEYVREGEFGEGKRK